MTDTTLDQTTYAELTADEIMDARRARQNFAAAVPAGLAAAIVGAVLWAVFVYTTNMALGLIVILIGALVGVAIRKTGHGIEPKFGVLGATCAAFSWALGTTLCDIAFLAKDAGVSVLDVLGRLGVGEILAFAFRAADGMDLLFLAIAVWEGYKFSFDRR